MKLSVKTTWPLVTSRAEAILLGAERLVKVHWLASQPSFYKPALIGEIYGRSDV